MKATEIVQKLLSNATDLETVKELTTDDATYVSLNYDDPDLQAIEPWCGTHKGEGPHGIWKTFVDVNTYWEVQKFDVYAIFGGTESIETGVHGPEGDKGTNVAVFGRFVYKSKTVGRITDSPFCVWAKVDEEKQKVTYMQFMEDTLDTAKSFRKSGKMVYASNPEDAHEVTIGED